VAYLLVRPASISVARRSVAITWLIQQTLTLQWSNGGNREPLQLIRCELLLLEAGTRNQWCVESRGRRMSAVGKPLPSNGIFRVERFLIPWRGLKQIFVSLNRRRKFAGTQTNAWGKQVFYWPDLIENYISVV
jgi:hypothetical protein